MSGPCWVEFDVGRVMSMPAIGYERIVTVGAGKHLVARPWFNWTGRNWEINVTLWRDGMVDGFRPPWSPGALAELTGTSPTAMSNELLPLGDAIKRAAGVMGLTLGPLPPRLARGGAGAVVHAGLPDNDFALVASETRMVVVTDSTTVQWFFEIAAHGFSYEAAKRDPCKSQRALKLLSKEHVSRIMPNRHACIASLQRECPPTPVKSRR